MAKGKRPTDKERRERIERAAQLLVEQAGARPYAIATRFMQAFKCSRPTANRYLHRARARLAEDHDGVLRDLAEALPGKFADALERARAAGDAKTEARLLDTLLKLAASAKQDQPDVEQLGIDLVIVEPEHDDGGNTNGKHGNTHTRAKG